MSEQDAVVTQQPLQHPVGETEHPDIYPGLPGPNDNHDSGLPQPDGNGFQHSKPFPVNGTGHPPPAYNVQQPPPPLAYVQPAPIPQGGVVCAPAPPPQVQHTTTVVTQQPGVTVVNQRARDWKYDWCWCCCPTPNMPCWCSCLCYPFYMCYLVHAMHETPWIAALFLKGPLWYPLTGTLLRLKMRSEQNIHGSICCDCFCSTVCPCMTLTQLGREFNDLQEKERNSGGIPMQQAGGGVTMVNAV